MATRKKTNAKHRPSSKRKAKSSNAPLLAATAAVRKAKPSEKATRSPAPGADAGDPAFAMFEFMARVTAAYAEFPSRLLQCRSPMDFWREQAWFAQRVLGESPLPGPTRSSTRSRKTR